jgi:hypothetical protein
MRWNRTNISNLHRGNIQIKRSNFTKYATTHTNSHIEADERPDISKLKTPLPLLHGALISSSVSN